MKTDRKSYSDSYNDEYITGCKDTKSSVRVWHHDISLINVRKHLLHVHLHREPHCSGPFDMQLVH